MWTEVPRASTKRERTVEHHGTDQVAGVGPLSSVPDSVIHRADEVSHLTAVLNSLTSGEQPNPILISGPAGSG